MSKWWNMHIKSPFNTPLMVKTHPSFESWRQKFPINFQTAIHFKSLAVHKIRDTRDSRVFRTFQIEKKAFKQKHVHITNNNTKTIHRQVSVEMMFTNTLTKNLWSQFFFRLSFAISEIAIQLRWIAVQKYIIDFTHSYITSQQPFMLKDGQDSVQPLD